MAYVSRRLLLVSAIIVLILSGSAFGNEPDISVAKAWFDKGMLFREAGNPRSTDAFKEAAADLNGYIDANSADIPGLVKAYALRARCHNLLGNNEQAIRDLDKAVELSSDGDIYYLRSFIYGMMGRSESSLADLKAAASKGCQKARGELDARGIH